MTDPGAAQAQRTAEAVRDGMFAQDNASKGLGMRIETIGPGAARIGMTVRADMLNGFAICHGGFITTLADSAFAFACNSYNHLTVASGIVVDFLAPAHEGDQPARQDRGGDARPLAHAQGPTRGRAAAAVLARRTRPHAPTRTDAHAARSDRDRKPRRVAGAATGAPAVVAGARL
jgi:phenylacetic acid degradation protein PaaD